MTKRTIWMCMMMSMLFIASSAQKSNEKRVAIKQKRNNTKIAVDLTTVEHLLPIYATAKTENSDFNSPMTGILVFYGGLNDNGKKECRKFLVKQMDNYYNSNKVLEALAVADIYENIAPINDSGMLRIYYYRGEHAATIKGDTIELKRQISNIEVLNDVNKDKKEECLYVLNTYLDEIRNYIPLDNTVDGMWLADIRSTTTGCPFFFLEIHTGDDGKPVFNLNKESTYYNYVGIWGKHQTAQEEYTFSTDSIYAIWSNEDMKNPSPELNYIFRQASGTFATAIGTKALIDGGNIAGNLTNGLASIGVNLLADAIFTPSKRAYVLQIKMKKINDRQIEADIYSSKLKVKGSNTPKITEDKWHAIFTKIELQDSLYWYDGIGAPVSPFEMSKEERKAFNKRYKYPKNLMNYNKMNIFNTMQTLKAIYRNEEKLIESGDTLSQIVNMHDPTVTSVIGIKFKDDSRMTIKEITPGFSADWYGLKKNDIITHIDGFAVNNYYQFKSLITRKKPFDTVTLKVTRGKKTIEKNIELYLIKQ